MVVRHQLMLRRGIALLSAVTRTLRPTISRVASRPIADTTRYDPSRPDCMTSWVALRHLQTDTWRRVFRIAMVHINRNRISADERVQLIPVVHNALAKSVLKTSNNL